MHVCVRIFGPSGGVCVISVRALHFFAAADLIFFERCAGSRYSQVQDDMIDCKVHLRTGRTAENTTQTVCARQGSAILRTDNRDQDGRPIMVYCSSLTKNQIAQSLWLSFTPFALFGCSLWRRVRRRLPSIVRNRLSCSLGRPLLINQQDARFTDSPQPIAAE